jgi:hypothetical protein
VNQAPEAVSIAPLFDEEELELAVEFGVARSCALVRELMRVPPQAIIPPRYLRWTRRLPQGVFVFTDRAAFLVPADDVDEFCPTLELMIRGELRGSYEGEIGNC